MPRMSSQAGRLRGRHNLVFIIIPCHRVVGSNNSLTGHTGGLSLKIGLLEHEGVDMSRFLFFPEELHYVIHVVINGGYGMRMACPCR